MINIWDKIIREGEKPSICNKTRLISLKKVLEESFENNLANWETYCLNVKKSNFLMGGGANHWKADLTWATKQENLIRVLESYYHQKEEKSLENTIKEEIVKEEETIKNPIWKKTRKKLKDKLGEGIFRSWIAKLNFQEISNQTVYLAAPTRFIKEWVLNNYSEDIKQNFNASGANIQKIFIQTA